MAEESPYNNNDISENLDSERYTKYKDLFEKHKNEDGFITHEAVNEIFNECGRKTTIEDTGELIKKINNNSTLTNIDFNNFVKLMESKDWDTILEKKEDTKKFSNTKIYLFMILLLITGSINTIANKYQQSTISLKIEYKGHQKFITFCMFLGEFLCLFFYWLKEGRKKKATSLIIEHQTEIKDDTKPKAKFWYYLFPSLFDICGSSISSISLTYLPSSIYQMFRGSIIIFTCIASILFLKNKYYRHHFLGICIVIIGLIIVGLNAILGGSNNFDSKIILGIFLQILSQVFSCMLLISEEKILKKFDIHPLKSVGMEGLWGAGCYLFLLIIFYQIRCESWPDLLKKEMCIEDDEKKIRFENAIFALKQLWASRDLKFFASLYIISIAFFNFSGLSISKYASATSRAVVDTLRTIVVWTFFLTMPFVPESAKETFEWAQLIGFIIMIIGSFIYNEILVLHFWGFGDNTKAEIKKREEQEKLLEKNNDV